MIAHKTHAVVNDQGQVLVEGTPFRPGERVEIIVLQQPVADPVPVRFPLPSPYRFDDPFSPVAAEEWEATK